MSTIRRPSYEGEPQVNYLTQVLDEIHNGLIRVPRFQRPFVWTDDQRLELFRSVIEGTPIGSIMVWRTTMDVPCFTRLGPHRLPAGPSRSTPRTYLLDGHQRLSTLYAALYPPEAHLEYDEDQDVLAHWKVYYDLYGQDLRLATDQGLLPPGGMPLHVVLDTRSHFAYLRELGASSEIAPDELAKLLARADGIAKAIREYKIPVIPVVSDDLDSVTRTFQRINSLGTPMSDVHMVTALTFGNDFDLSERLDSARTQLREEGWEADDKTLLQVCKVIVGLDLYESGIDDVASSIKSDREAVVQKAVQLLGEAGRLLSSWGIQSPDVVPYAHQPVLLAAAAFASGGAIDVSLEPALRRWFWLTSFFGDANKSRVQVEHRRVVRIAKGIPPDFLDLKPEPLPWRFDFRHARIRAMLHLLARRGPRDPDGEPLDAPGLLARCGHKAVGRIVTDHQKGTMETPARALASGPENIFIIHPERLTAMRNHLRQCDDSSWLESHLVSPEALSRLRQGDLVGFLERRAMSAQDMEDAFIQDLNGPEYRRRPTTSPGREPWL